LHHARHLFALAENRLAVLVAGRPLLVFGLKEFGVPRDDVRGVQHLVAQQAVQVVEEVALGFEVFGADGVALGFRRLLDSPRLGHADTDPDAGADRDGPAQPRDRQHRRPDREDGHQRDVQSEGGDGTGDRPQPDARVAAGFDGTPVEPVPRVRDAHHERRHCERPHEELTREHEPGFPRERPRPQADAELHDDERAQRGGSDD
jgi:hypothetical protein